MISSASSHRWGIMGVGSVSPMVAVADPEKNVDNILEALSSASLSGCSVVVLPELCITGYSCGDLFFQDVLIDSAARALMRLAKALECDSRLVAVGVPLLRRGLLYNCAALISGGKIAGVVPKINIPNYQEFYEKRWFASGRDIKADTIDILGEQTPFGTSLIFNHEGMNIGVEICEDLWVPSPPSSSLCEAGADIILNLSASDENIGKFDYLSSLIASQSGRCRCGYVYSSAGTGESSTDLVFAGFNIIACDGSIVAQSERFSSGVSYAMAYVDVEKLRNDRRKFSTFYSNTNTLKPEIIPITPKSEIALGNYGADVLPGLKIDPHPFIPADEAGKNAHCGEIVRIQSAGLAQRLRTTHCSHLVVGISGGLDSTLALLVAHYTFKKLNLDPKGIIGVTMPSEATSSRTHSNAVELMRLLDVTALEIPIKEAVALHFRDIGHDPTVMNAVYENAQARERTQILMDLANKYGGMVLGTGDMSELALGWCTYNGDQMSMYNVNGGVPKTLVRHLVRWFADTTEDKALRDVLLDIIETPISPELVPSQDSNDIGQKTEELVGPYELHDFFLFHTLRNGYRPSKIFFLASRAFDGKYDKRIIQKWLVSFYRRFFSQQFKRSCMPDGPKVGSVCLSPRGDWRMPSDASAEIWIAEAETLNTE